MNRKIAKISYTLLGGVLMLSSCAQEDAPDKPGDGSDRRIVFHTSLPKPTTKAMEIVTELPYFYMTAFDETDSRLIAGDTLKGYFYNKKLMIEAGNSNVVSDECIWPDQGYESDVLHFFAYYPQLPSGATLVNGTSVGANKAIGYKINGYRVETDISRQVDFVTAYTKGSMDDNYFSGINLTFRHQLSRIEVKVKGSHKSCDIEIAGVCIANVPMQGTFEFQKSDADGNWTDLVRGNAEYIFREGDKIVQVGSNEVPILSSKIDSDNDNYALLIPTTSPAWAYTNDAGNSGNGIYLNVLLRIIDKTPTTGKGKVQYPYYDNSQGLNAMNIPREYFAVVTATGIVSKRLYKNGNGYCTDAALTQPYTPASGEEIREFGWAALPVSANWRPGYSYSYTLDYTSGVGVHGPNVIGNVSPKSGDPIISDIIGVTVSVNEWQGLNGSTTHTVEVPGA